MTKWKCASHAKYTSKQPNASERQEEFKKVENAQVILQYTAKTMWIL